MTDYEQLLETAHIQGINVYELDLGVDLPCGKCIDNCIVINKRISDKEKYCVLSEEIGHFKFTVGNITNLNDIRNIKQENTARSFSYQTLVGINKLIDAYKLRIGNQDLADYLGITNQFLIEALSYYEHKYGNWYAIDNYIIRFNPLGIVEKFENF
ncbi:MAG: ImmA/IrrE family metallo-endopeptidase [Clostridium chrysemydis]|uniref:ImmA/IrrE family metallo-endopeptidase n=1 Tax=Clostridium chrysemydis TaxID=2665504 RepID=UPI003F2FA859